MHYCITKEALITGIKHFYEICNFLFVSCLFFHIGTLIMQKKGVCHFTTEDVKEMTIDLTPLKSVKSPVLQLFFKQMFVSSLLFLESVVIIWKGNQIGY